MILGLNVLLLGGGVALVLEYLNKRDRIASGPATARDVSNHSRTGARAASTPDTAPEAGNQSGGASTGDSRATAREPGNSQPSDSSGKIGSGTKSSGRSQPSVATGRAATAREASRQAPQALETPLVSSDADEGAAGAEPAPPGLSVADGGIASPTVHPELTEEERARQVTLLAGKIGIVVERHQSHLGRCYESALKQTNPRDKEKLEGRIDLHFSVQPDGSAKGIRVRSNSTGSAVLGKCLVALVGSWTFPSSGSEALDFVWPFEFQAPE